MTLVVVYRLVLYSSEYKKIVIKIQCFVVQFVKFFRIVDADLDCQFTTVIEIRTLHPCQLVLSNISLLERRKSMLTANTILVEYILVRIRSL